MTKRQAISARSRFEVFKRDGFTCMYCGRKPPTVLLECDHIDPVALGGTNDQENLVTSCWDCNRGKSDVPLSQIPESLADRAERIAEGERQVAAYAEMVRDVREAREERAWEVIERLFGPVESVPRARLQSVKQFLDRLPFDEVMDAADIASGRGPFSDGPRFRYFCAVCWNKIKGGGE